MVRAGPRELPISGICAQGGGPVPPPPAEPPGGASGGWGEGPPAAGGPPGGWGGPPIPPPGGYGPPPVGAGPHENLRKEADLWFVLSLISIVCCCVFGIVGAILAYQSKDLILQNRIEEARSKIQAAKVVTLIGIGLVFLIILLQVVLTVFGMVFSI